RRVNRSEVDCTGERNEHPRLQIEPVELIELAEGVADGVIGVGARRLHDASDVRVVDALAEVDAPSRQLACVGDGEGVVWEDPRSITGAAHDGNRRLGRNPWSGRRGSDEEACGNQAPPN